MQRGFFEKRFNSTLKDGASSCQVPPVTEKQMITTEIQELEEILGNQGLSGALKFLNQRVTHRYTAIYRLDKNNFEIVLLIDKLDDAAQAPPSRIPFYQSFCEIALQDGGFITSNSAFDKRLDAKPLQGVITSYVGLPLMHSGGDLYGTLCHIDYDHQPISDDEFAFLQQAALLISRSL